MKEASLVQIKTNFDMNTVDFLKQWHGFSEEEKQWWRIEVGKLIEGKENENNK